MALHVHLLHLYSTESTDELRARLHPDICLTEGPELVDPETIDILVSGFPKAEHLDPCTRLRALVVPFAGVPKPTTDLLLNYPQVELYSVHYNAVPTAEMAVALLLAAAKIIVPLDRAFRRGDWSARYGVTSATMLEGKTALVLGYGQIGRRIARACKGLGMEVLGVRRTVTAPVFDEGVEIFPSSVLHALLPRSDALIMALPETPETTGMVGAQELALLRPGAIVVNVGRGPTLDEEALYSALCDGRLRGAGIDVWYSYPTTPETRTNTSPSRFPFHELDNVVMSPHRAGWLSEAEQDRMTLLADLLNAAAEGRHMPGYVDKALGY